MGTGSTTFICFAGCFGFVLLSVFVAGILVALGRREEARALAARKALEAEGEQTDTPAS